MVHSRGKHKKNKRTLLGSHQRSWIWGRHAVMEILEAGRWPVAELYLDGALPGEERERARELVGRHRAEVFVEPRERIEQLCHTAEHQGYLARMRPFPYTDIEDIMKLLHERGDASGNVIPAFTLAVLDGVQDPYNFGAIVRTAEVLGVVGVVIGETGQVGVTSMVARSSAGAVNRVPIARTDELAGFLARLRARGIDVVGTDEHAQTTTMDHDFNRPTALILGNEGEGIGEDLRRLCTAMVRIPRCGAIGSLNVAAAAAVLFYEALRQQR